MQCYLQSNFHTFIKNSIRKTKTEKIKENDVTREYEKTNIVHVQHFWQVFGQNTLANSMSSQRSE